MSDYSNFRRSSEFTGWLRAPAADLFVKQIEEKLETANAELRGACSMSHDPKVVRAHARVVELEELRKFLKNSRKESGEDE